MIRPSKAFLIVSGASLLAAVFFIHPAFRSRARFSQIQTSPSPTFRCCIRSSVHFQPRPNADWVSIRMLVVPARLDHQRLLSRTSVPLPSDSGSDEGGAWLEWRFPRPADSHSVTLEQCVERQPHDLASTTIDTGSLEDPSEYLGADSLHPLDDPELRGLALSVPPGSPVQRTIFVWDTVKSRLRYGGYDPVDQGAAKALASGRGDCSEFSDLQASLMRILGIATRTPRGWTLSNKRTESHQWLEAHLPGRGWTEFDPLWAALGHTPIGEVPGLRIELSHRPIGPAMHGQSRTFWRWEGATPSFSWRDSLWEIR